MTHKSTQPWSLHSCHGDHSLWSFVAQVTIFTMWTLPHISYLSVCLSLLIFSTPAMRTSSPLPWSSSTMRLLVLQGHPTAYTNYLLLTAAVTRTNILLEQFTFICNTQSERIVTFCFGQQDEDKQHYIVSGWLICASVFFWFWSFSNFLVRRPGGIAPTLAPSLVVV